MGAMMMRLASDTPPTRSGVKSCGVDMFALPVHRSGRQRARCAPAESRALRLRPRPRMRLDSPLFAGGILLGAIVLLWTVLLVAKRVLGARILAAAQLTRTAVDDLVVHLIDHTGLMAVVFAV